MKKILNKLKNIFLDSLYPKHIKCICCGEELDKNAIYDICPKCYDDCHIIYRNHCIRCGAPIPDNSTSVCFNCKSTNFDFVGCRACFAYSGKIRSAIYKFKYKHQSFLAESFARFMTKLYATTDWNIDLVTYVPLHPKREKTRGYNQSKLLAIEFCKITKLPLFDTTERVVDTPSQTSKTRDERIKNVKDAFKIKKNIESNIIDKNILVIDDVYTTGSTANEISKLLLKYGAKNIYILTLAHGENKKDI